MNETGRAVPGPLRPLSTPLALSDPTQIGAYVLVGRLGVGAMGRVYLARSAAGRLVAVKTIRHEYADEPDFRARFAQEVAAARQVSGVFTAAVVAADPDADLPWLATAYVPAPALDVLVQRCGPLPVPAVRWLAAGCAEALESIHEAGLVHRDLKPSNVLVAPDGPRVIDFGVARAAERVALTTTRGSVGTPAYMAPEQARDTRRAVVASDVFSLGATLLFAATGRAPYQGETVMDVLVRLATEPPDLSDVPPELADLLARCLERDPAARPTPAALVAEVAPYLHVDGGQAFGSSLPATALALIDEYRHSTLADAGPNPTSDDSTLGSRPGTELSNWPPLASSSGPGSSGPSFSGPPFSGPGPHGPMLRGPSRRWPSRRFRGRRRGDATRVAPRTAADGQHRRRIVSVVAAAGVVAALMIAGGLVGRWTSASLQGTSGSGPLTSTAGQPDAGLGVGAEPLPPLSGASDLPSAPLSIAVNQPFGDGNTVFVVHGRGWPPGATITIGLTGVRTSPDKVVADRRGTFNYAVNQAHEFFPAGLPPAWYQLVATASGARRAQVSFRVGG